jgi:hypothetical protein
MVQIKIKNIEVNTNFEPWKPYIDLRFPSGHWLYWNNEISIDDLKDDVIVLVGSMFVNLKLHSLNDIIFKKIIKHVVVKTKQTYIERSFF